MFLGERTETVHVLQTLSQNGLDKGDSYVETGQHYISEMHSYDSITCCNIVLNTELIVLNNFS